MLKEFNHYLPVNLIFGCEKVVIRKYLQKKCDRFMKKRCDCAESQAGTDFEKGTVPAFLII